MSTRIRELAGGLVRYGLVGVVNATTYYATYLLAHPHAGYLVAHAVGLGAAMVVSFLLNCRVTFRVRPTLMRFLLYPASQVVNIAATTAGVVGLVELGTDQRLAPLVAAALALPISFLAARLLMTRGARGPVPVPLEPATLEPATSEPATSEPATSEPATSEPATPEPATPEPVTTAAPSPTADPVVPPLPAAVLRALDDPELARATTRPFPELSGGAR